MEPTAPKTVLHVGCGVNLPHKLHPVFHTPEWREVRLDIDPDVQPDQVGTAETIDAGSSAGPAA